MLVQQQHNAMSPSQLELLPEPLELDSPLATFVQDAFHMVDPDTPAFSSIRGTREPVQVFIARTPDLALKWICERVSKELMIRLVNDCYNTIQLDNVSDDGDGENTPPTTSRNTKRKRRSGQESTTAVSRRLKEKMDFALMESASTQDLENAKKDDMTLLSEDLRYRAFVKGLGGIGINEAAEMINRAKAVASFNSILDWCTILETWRDIQNEGKRLFAGDGRKLFMLDRARVSLVGESDKSSVGGVEDVDMDEDTGQLVPSQQAGAPNVADTWTKKEIAGFRQLFASVRRSETAGILGDMRHRWSLATLYIEYLRLEEILRKRVVLTSTRGRGIATVARDQLFTAVFNHDGVVIPEDERAARYRNWNRYLEYGKRWSMLKEKFGVGIFAVLPRGGVPNSFVERRNIQRLAEWLDMLAECNDRVKELSVAMEPLLLCCMQEDEPPPRLLLETIDAEGFEDTVSTDLLMPVADTQRTFEHVSEDEIIIEDSQLSE